MLLDAPADLLQIELVVVVPLPTTHASPRLRVFAVAVASALELPAIRRVRIDKLKGIYIHVAPHVVYLFYCLLPFFLLPCCLVLLLKNE